MCYFGVRFSRHRVEQKHRNRIRASSSVGARPSSAAPVEQNHLNWNTLFNFLSAADLRDPILVVLFDGGVRGRPRSDRGACVYPIWVLLFDGVPEDGRETSSKTEAPVQRPNTQSKMSPDLGSVSAILLAAGQSRRMGAFKPLLPFGKTTVIESCINYLTTGGVDSVVVVVGYRADDIRKQLSNYPVLFAVNSDPASEMAASIAAGVRQLPASTGAVLISPADYPAIPPAVIASILSEWSRGYRLVKPTWQGDGGHPVLVDLSFRADLLELEPATGLKGLFERHKADVRRVEVDSPYVARDLDTWDDYDRLHSEIFGVCAPARSGPNSN